MTRFQVHNKILQAPGRSLGPILKFLGPNLPEDLSTRLSAFQGAVVKCLLAQAEGQSESTEGNVGELASELPGLKTMVLDMKTKTQDS